MCAKIGVSLAKFSEKIKMWITVLRYEQAKN